jgi:insulysin
MIATSPMLSYTVIPDESNLPILNPEFTDQKIMKLRLENGLQALIISDPKAEQSAASVSVAVGSWNDPAEYPGMAHLCEHMLFMGTKKYPGENDFDIAVSNYAGKNNAYTDPNQTVYMFSAQARGFTHLFDQFAHFFIDPLFNPSSIAREMHAVDQEFAQKVENDGQRMRMIFKETGNPSHPNRLFSCGNFETLAKISPNTLKKWYEENYGAEKLRVAVYSSLPMEQLKEMVVQTFGQVPQTANSCLDMTARLSSSEQIRQIIFIKPIQNKQLLTLSWELPPEFAADPTKSADILAYALQRGHPHSLYEKLKEEQWIDNMSVHLDKRGQQHLFFQISLELTRKGIEEFEKAILRCFQAIAGIRETGVPNYIFQEKNTMNTLHYEYQEREDPFEYIRGIGTYIGNENLSTFPRNLFLSSGYEPKKIQEVANLLRPQNCLINLLAAPELTKVFPDRKEKWSGAEYAIRPIPEKWLADWSSAKPNEAIRLPPPNPFIPQNLAIVGMGSSIPALIANNEWGQAYYVRSPEFHVPESIYDIHILSPAITPTARSSVLASLYIDHLTDKLFPTLSAAYNAGLACSLDLVRSSLHLRVMGYSEKATLLLEEVARQMPYNPPTAEQFAIYVDRHEKIYINNQKKLALEQAEELLYSIVNPNKMTSQAQLTALKTISYEDFLQYHKNLFEKIYVQALFAGNLDVKQAESAWLDVIRFLGKAPFPKESHPSAKIARLPANGGPYEITKTTDVQGNAALLLIDAGNFTYEKRAAQQILTAVICEAFYNELRTKQKTGYSVQSYEEEIAEQLFQIFRVQSNSHQPADLLYRFEQFIETFNDNLTENIPLDRFETIRTNAIFSMKTRFRNLSNKANLWAWLAFEKDGNFNFIEHRIEGLDKLTYKQFQQISHAFLSRENRKRLAILFQGKLTTPFSYEAISVSELNQISTYVPREKMKGLQESSFSPLD